MIEMIKISWERFYLLYRLQRDMYFDLGYTYFASCRKAEEDLKMFYVKESDDD